MERGPPCPRGVLAKLLTTRGHGCPRSFREILESAVAMPHRSEKSACMGFGRECCLESAPAASVISLFACAGVRRVHDKNLRTMPLPGVFTQRVSSEPSDCPSPLSFLCVLFV